MTLEGCMLTDTHSASGDGAIRGALEGEFEKPCSVMEEERIPLPLSLGKVWTVACVLRSVVQADEVDMKSLNPSQN